MNYYLTLLLDFKMFKKILFSISLLALFTQISFAKKLDIDVKGMVCEFCVVTLQKGFMKQESIKECEVSLEEKKIFLTFKKDANLTDDEITKIVEDNGYNVAKINR